MLKPSDRVMLMSCYKVGNKTGTLLNIDGDTAVVQMDEGPKWLRCPPVSVILQLPLAKKDHADIEALEEAFAYNERVYGKREEA